MAIDGDVGQRRMVSHSSWCPLIFLTYILHERGAGQCTDTTIFFCCITNDVEVSNEDVMLPCCTVLGHELEGNRCGARRLVASVGSRSGSPGGSTRESEALDGRTSDGRRGAKA